MKSHVSISAGAAGVVADGAGEPPRWVSHDEFIVDILSSVDAEIQGVLAEIAPDAAATVPRVLGAPAVDVLLGVLGTRLDSGDLGCVDLLLSSLLMCSLTASQKAACYDLAASFGLVVDLNVWHNHLCANPPSSNDEFSASVFLLGDPDVSRVRISTASSTVIECYVDSPCFSPGVLDELAPFLTFHSRLVYVLNRFRDCESLTADQVGWAVGLLRPTGRTPIGTGSSALLAVLAVRFPALADVLFDRLASECVDADPAREASAILMLVALRRFDATRVAALRELLLCSDSFGVFQEVRRTPGPCADRFASAALAEVYGGVTGCADRLSPHDRLSASALTSAAAVEAAKGLLDTTAVGWPSLVGLAHVYPEALDFLDGVSDLRVAGLAGTVVSALRGERLGLNHSVEVGVWPDVSPVVSYRTKSVKSGFGCYDVIWSVSPDPSGCIDRLVEVCGTDRLLWAFAVELCTSMPVDEMCAVLTVTKVV